MKRLLPWILVVALAGCGGTVTSTTFGEVGDTIDTPAPTDAPSAAPDEATLVVIEGSVVDGPGTPIAEAVASAGDGTPKLVNGSLMMDTDGSIWLCDHVEVYNPPQCIWPRLRVENYPEGGAEWDLSSADVTGLLEQDGVLWFESSQLYGEIVP
jgi:hypothetical protein